MNSAKVTVPATSGVPIYLSIGSALAGQEGPFQLFAGCSPAQANDSCTGAIPVVMGVNGPFDDLMASDGGSPPNASGCVGPTWMFQNDVWFSWTSPVTGGVRIDTCGATYNAHVLVFDACGGTQVACALFDGATCAGGGSFLTLAAVQGQSYRIRVDGLLPLVSGQFHLRITGPYTLVLDAPSPGKVRMSSHSGTPLLPYFSAVTAVPGAFPNGAFYGIDVQTQELLAEWAMGFPFAGTLDANGDSTPFILSGVPPGLVFHAVSVTYDAATLAVIDVTAPVTFTTS
jgi:hypothetical protein